MYGRILSPDLRVEDTIGGEEGFEDLVKVMEVLRSEEGCPWDREQTHKTITKDLLEHGFNVLTEKPFGRSYYECMDLINTAKKHGVTVVAFHQTLLTPPFLNVKNIIRSGKLGEILQINVKYSGFARRWDWQTLQKKCAGSTYNTDAQKCLCIRSISVIQHRQPNPYFLFP